MKYFAIIILCWGAISLTAQIDLKLESGTTIKVSGDVEIVLQNTSFINNGTFIANDGIVHVTGNGTSNQSSIGGTNPTTFYNIVINKSANNAELNQNITLQNNITLTNGNLELNNYDLTLNGDYTSNNGHYFQTSGTGSLKREITNGAIISFPVGNNSCTPMIIKNDGTADVFSVRIAPEVLQNGTSGNAFTTNVVNQTWFVTEATTGGSNLTLTATWNASNELTGFDRTQCYISNYTGSGWNGDIPSEAMGSDPFSISRSGITSVSSFAIGSNSALPIELLDFYAFRDGENVKLEWKTATEINSDIFEIEHSTDAIEFKKIGEVEAATFSDSELNYDFLHQNPFNRINYYRLVMRDLDGSFEYSEVKSVDFTNVENSDNLVTIYPNPTSDILNIRFLKNIEEGSLELYNELGQKVLEKDLDHNLKNTISIRDFPRGIYFLNLNLDGQSTLKRIFISN